jgi:hypothetical protein
MVSLQEVVIPLKRGDPSLFNQLKRMNFALLLDMVCLRRKDAQECSRLFAVASTMGILRFLAKTLSISSTKILLSTGFDM